MRKKLAGYPRRAGYVRLTFRLQGPPFGEVDVALDENDSKMFMDEMAKIAEGS